MTLITTVVTQLSSEPVKKIIQLSHTVTPFMMKKGLMEKLINSLLESQLEEEEFYFLDGRLLGLDVTDLNIRVIFSLKSNKIVMLPSEQAETWIRGKASAFMQLANRKQDPDTLFFQRQLLIEGDTELGLNIKNVLDSFDWDECPSTAKRVLSILEQLSPT